MQLFGWIQLILYLLILLLLTRPMGLYLVRVRIARKDVFRSRFRMSSACCIVFRLDQKRTGLEAVHLFLLAFSL